jgi:hypothetical protein
LFVFDSSAFINGANHHYFVDTMQPVWALVEEAIDDGRVIVPREVFNEVENQQDEMSKLVIRRRFHPVIATRWLVGVDDRR